jgi:hypothetical protein
MTTEQFIPVKQDRDRLKQYIEQLKAHHALLLSLCDALERVADSLPARLDSQVCLTLARCILPTIKGAQSLEEEQLFPLLKRLHCDDETLTVHLERFEAEHLEDQIYAEEISCLLHDCGCQGSPANAEAAGYMLRGFFSMVRRHIAHERDCLLPLSAYTLQP